MNRYGYSVIVHGVKKNVKPFFFLPLFVSEICLKVLMFSMKPGKNYKAHFIQKCQRRKKKKKEIEYVPEE